MGRVKTKIIKVDPQKPEKEAIEKAADALKRGGVVCIPTDTVYGLAAGAFDLKAQKKIYKLKGRSYKKPLVVMACGISSVLSIGKAGADAAALMKNFWPGPLTVILEVTETGRILMGGRKDAGFRIPKAEIIRKLIKAYGLPIVTTSANPSGKKEAVSGSEAARYFKGKADLILDGGICGDGRVSTVLDVTRHPYTVVRRGCLCENEIIQCLERKRQ